MTILPFVEGYPSEYNLLEEYGSEDYDSEVYSNWTEAAPYSNLFESVYYDVLQDGLIDVEYVPAHAAPTLEAENAIEQSVVVEAVEADATMGSEIAVEEEEDRFVEGNPSEYNLLEDYASEDYDSEVYSNWTEAAPYSNLFESVYYDVLPDVWIDEYVPAHAAPTLEAENAIEQSVVAEAVEADATLESEIVVEEEDTMSEWYEEEDATLESEFAVEEEEDTMNEWYEEEDATLESEIAVEEEEDTMNEWYEGEDATLESEIAVEEEEDTMNEWYEGEDATLESEIAVEEEEDTMSEWYGGEDATLESENAVEEEEDTMSEWYEEEASEDEAWVAGEEGSTIQDFAESNVPFEGETWIAGEDATIEDSVYTIGSILSF